ncbi:hypothetical protein EIP91_011240 [Steccherinum ochraceum]|uniref:Hemerythrin-like domain-containing protein n=1 Tax=Steccherinum ochraceum TaxID=92696 RepID=A0A4R0RYN4_9APHY|nr:hypothetical protein EIP91_011240 [Steccherinum ochraceum]
MNMIQDCPRALDRRLRRVTSWNDSWLAGGKTNTLSSQLSSHPKHGDLVFVPAIMSFKMDITRELKIDHDNIRDLLKRYKACDDPGQRKAIANTLIREMVIHGDAQEETLKKHFASTEIEGTFATSEGKSPAAQNHAQVRETLQKSELEKPTEGQFDEVFKRLATIFVEHADEREKNLFPKIRELLSPEDNNKLAREFLRARIAVAPRALPRVYDSTNCMPEPPTNLQGKTKVHLDKEIKTIGTRKFVDMKYSHAI